MSLHSAECVRATLRTHRCVHQPAHYKLMRRGRVHLNVSRRREERERERSYLDFEDLLPKLIGSLIRQARRMCTQHIFSRVGQKLTKCKGSEFGMLQCWGQDSRHACHVDHLNGPPSSYSKHRHPKNSRQECDNLSSIEMNGATVRVVPNPGG